MSFLEIIGAIFIGPLKILFEIIFQIADKFINNPGISIIFLSLAINILVLPLYRRADAMQEQARDIDAKLNKGVSHIKKTFSGDEKMMMLQTYYRQNNYKPTDALNGSVSLLLEIPFFITAYQFLSHLQSLNGAVLGPIRDLSQPDNLLVIGKISINVLPIVMTLVNLISSYIYLKGFPAKTKIQLYVMALFFLVFLYKSPAGLVFYWTLNNIFSLVKTIFYKLKNPRKILNILISFLGILLLIFTLFILNVPSHKLKIFLIILALLSQIPICLSFTPEKLKKNFVKSYIHPDKKMFFIGCLFLTLLTGLLIPSTFIAASPQEYVDITYFHHPLWYVANTLALSAGTFLIWFRVFYWISSPKGKSFFDKLVWILCGVMFINYMFFGTNLGIISASLKYDNGMLFSKKEQLLNIVAIIITAAILFLIISKWKKLAFTIVLTITLAVSIMSCNNIYKIKKSVDTISTDELSIYPNFELSTKGKNVVIIMLDRGMGAYIPYIFNEKPYLKEQFSGFTYYSNTMSYGGHTNFALPAMIGGYEYTPVELNRRSDTSLVEKHNEALKVLPVLFNSNGFKVTVCDPTYANYQWVPDLSIYDDYPDIKKFITKGSFTEPHLKQAAIDSNTRNFFCFSIMKAMPLFIQPTIYNNGTYNQSNIASEEVSYTGQYQENMSVATGLSSEFMENYNTLCNLPTITKITDENINTFLFIENDIPHSAALLQEPEYIPAQNIDNTEYDANHLERFTVNGVTMRMETTSQMAHYQTNMAALIKIGEWLDYLKENNVYDNTRIIIVSDHGYTLGQFDEFYHDEINDKITETYSNGEYVFPILLVKDFNSKDFTESHDFMTNADVPTIAVADIIDNPINPFTGKLITNSEKNAHPQFIIDSDEWGTDVNNGNTFLPSKWISIKNDIWIKSNWEYYDEDIILDQHEFPDVN